MALSNETALIVVATIAAIPASIAAFASVAAARRTKTTNGRKLGRLAEDMNRKLDSHVNDARVHHAVQDEGLKAEIAHRLAEDVHRAAEDER
jgi:hypothetical protein